MSRPAASNFLFWLPMQEASGTRYDVTGNGRHATASGWGGWGAPPQAAGHVLGHAADFDGSSDNLMIADASWQSGDVDMSGGGWFYVDTASGIIMSKGGYLNEVCNFSTYVSGSPARIRFVAGDNSSEPGSNGLGYTLNYPAVDTSFTVSTGTWYYYIWMHDASANTGYIYVYDTSGNTVASDSTGLYCTWGNNNSSYGIFFGTSGNSTYNSWPISVNLDKYDGRMEQMFMYSGILSSAERAWMVNSGVGRSWRAWQTAGSIPTMFFKDIRWWLKRDGSLRNQRIIEELWNQNQAGLPLPVRS